MNADDQPDKSSGMEERWRTVFDKIFEELRTNHPADEWTIRLVDQLITIKGAEDVSGPPTPELVVDETTDKEENNLEVAATTPERVDDEIQKEVNDVEHEPASSLHKVDDSIGGEFINPDGSEREELPKTADPTEVVNPETSLNVSQQEKADQPLDMQPEQPVEPDGILVAAGHQDDQVDCAMTEILADQVQAVQLHLEAAGEVATKQGDQGEINECPDEAVEKLQESESGSSIGLEARDNSQQVWSEKENEPTLIHDHQKIQETIETDHVTINGEGQIEPVHIQEIPPEQLREINETLAVLDAVTIDTSTNQQQTTEVNVIQVADVQTPPETKDEIIQNNENPSEEIKVDQVVVENGHQEKAEETVALTPQSDPLIETHFDSANSESTQVIQVQQVVEAVGEMTKDASLVENLITDDDPPRQVDELEVTPVQVITPARPITPVQRLGASSPQLAASSNGDGQLKPVVSATKKSPGKSPENEVIRKPEWMRRPLVRKGSVGRFLGRMKETMQSKRFHPDRLPVVPPPQPEPPKRPPRRKTLANLDLSREPETTNKELTLPAPPTPKSAPVSEFENKSATLRSNVSDRKRKNSVGRFIGRVLSTKHLNATEVTAAEEAPLLNQEPQNTGQQPPHSPTTPRSSTPAPSEKSKKGPAMAVNDMGIFLRRILRPKTAAAEESKDKPTPQRPPPPSRHQTPIPNEKSFDNKDEQNKPVIKTGKVHFECQTCHHEWKSARGIAKCEIMVNQVGEGIRQGEIFVRLYGQQCKRCTSHVFETAEWSAEGIAKVLTDLRAVVGRRFYPDEDVPKAHQKRLCQACQEGVCQSKTSR